MQPTCLTCGDTGKLSSTELCQNCNHIANEDDIYTVQTLTLYDVQQATGDPNLSYTHREMLALAELLEEHTYEGDVWSDIINQYHGDFHSTNNNN